MNPITEIKYKNIIFDLDGTLIDSAKGILDCIMLAFKYHNITPNIELHKSLIGPPLKETISVLLSDNKIQIDTIIDTFKTYYDDFGYKESRLFFDVKKTLNDLKQHDHKLYLATNKRTIPTKKIIDYFGWNDLFDKVYTLDTHHPALKSKSQLLTKLIEENHLDITNTVYIGDRHSDFIAAKNNNIFFKMVNWGYENE